MALRQKLSSKAAGLGEGWGAEVDVDSAAQTLKMAHIAI